MNLYTFSIGASHTPAAFLVVVGAGLPFDLTDTVASFLFGLAFGPELARLLARMRARMEINGKPTHPAQAPIPGARTPGAASRHSPSAGCVGHASGARRSPRSSPSSPPPRAPTAASAPPRGESSSELYTAWAAIGLAAAGRDPAQRAS